MFPFGPLLSRRKFLIPFGMLVSTGAVSTCLTLWAGQQLASPPRKPLAAYHREFLSDPAAHGVRIERFTANDGTPALVCTPEGTPGMRGTIIRQQLVARGLPLPNYGEVKGTLVLLHGRKGRKEDYLPVAERFCAAGFRCIIPDLPGHGEHPRKITTYGVREAALPEHVLNEAAQRFGFTKQPCGLVGISMGGSVAAHSAGMDGAPWKALVIIASFDALEPTVRGQASVRVGEALADLWTRGAAKVYQSKTGISLASIRPCEPAEKILIPTLVAHGTNDKITPISSGRKLYGCLPRTIESRWIEIPGAGHDNVLITEFPIYATIAEWMMDRL